MYAKVLLNSINIEFLVHFDEKDLKSLKNVI